MPLSLCHDSRGGGFAGLSVGSRDSDCFCDGLKCPCVCFFLAFAVLFLRQKWKQSKVSPVENQANSFVSPLGDFRGFCSPVMSLGDSGAMRLLLKPFRALSTLANHCGRCGALRTIHHREENRSRMPLSLDNALWGEKGGEDISRGRRMSSIVL